MSGASERVNGRASGPVLQSVFLVILTHSVKGERGDDKTISEPIGFNAYIRSSGVHECPCGKVR